jgi:penicillin amidase
VTASENLSLPGLEAEAEILIDRWGIPHIYAASQRDAFFVQGFNAARDRLWQIDLWRKRGLGLMAADLGPAYAERDRAARLLLYRGDMAAEWACYGADAQARTTAFVAGINAYIDLVEREPRGCRWSSARSARSRSAGTRRTWCAAAPMPACATWIQEVARTNIVAAFGPEADRLHKGLQPEWRLQIPKGWSRTPSRPR